MRVPSIQNIRVHFKADGRVSRREKEKMIEMAQKYSPVFNSITKSAVALIALKM